jgi:uncharacterized protein YpuA (DUF1002 family)
MKIALTANQIEQLRAANINISFDSDFVEDEIETLEDQITEYVMQNEIDEASNITELGAALIEIHDDIVNRYDS